MSINTLKDVSDKIYEEPNQKRANRDCDLSTWGDKNSEASLRSSSTPIPRQTPNILIKQKLKRDDPYAVIQKYETLHMKMKQDKVNQMIEKSLKTYTENKKKLQTMNNTITTKYRFPPMTEVYSPREPISSKKCFSKSHENVMSPRRKSVFAIKEELSKYLEEVITKEKERKVNDNIRKFMSESKNSEKTEYVPRSKMKDGKLKLKRKFILHENGLEERKRMKQYPKQNRSIRETREKYPNYLIEENDASTEIEERFKLPLITAFNITTPSVSTRVRTVNFNLSL